MNGNKHSLHAVIKIVESVFFYRRPTKVVVQAMALNHLKVLW